MFEWLESFVVHKTISISLDDCNTPYFYSHSILSVRITLLGLFYFLIKKFSSVHFVLKENYLFKLLYSKSTSLLWIDHCLATIERLTKSRCNLLERRVNIHNVKLKLVIMICIDTRIRFFLRTHNSTIINKNVVYKCMWCCT